MKVMINNLPSAIANVLAGLLADILSFASFCYRYESKLKFIIFLIVCTVIIHAYLIRNVLC